MRYEVHKESDCDKRPIVTLAECWHEPISKAVAVFLAPLKASTVKATIPKVEASLNLFFDPVPYSRTPIITCDRELGVAFITEKLQSIQATVVRKTQMGMGTKVSFTDDAKARHVDDLLHVGRMIVDAMGGDNPFVRPNFVPEPAVRGTDGKTRRDTGRWFSVSVPAYTINTSGNPHLADDIDKAFTLHSKKPGPHWAWRTKQSLISRGREAVEAKMRSLYEGAIKAGEREFGAVWLLPDKPTGPSELVKLAALKEDYEPVFYGKYLDGVRKELDPKGWGKKDYEEACWDGDEDALSTPIFYNQHGRPLTIGTATDEFRLVVRAADIKCGDRYAWMHLGRHDEVVQGLDLIEAMDVPEYVKDQLRDDLATYMGWRSKEEMLKVYGARHFAARAAATTIGWQSGRPAATDPTNSFVHSAELVAAFQGR